MTVVQTYQRRHTPVNPDRVAYVRFCTHQSAAEGPSHVVDGGRNDICAKLHEQTHISCTIARQRLSQPDLRSQLCEAA